MKKKIIFKGQTFELKYFDKEGWAMVQDEYGVFYSLPPDADYEIIEPEGVYWEYAYDNFSITIDIV